MELARRIKIRSFRAIDDREGCDNYIIGHKALLESYGVKEVVAKSNDWVYNHDCYVILVEDLDSNKALGGARIQVKSENMLLPMEDAVGKMDANIFKIVSEFSKKGTAEFCGLWNSREVAGLGIGSVFLGRAGVARAGVVISEQLNISSMFVLAASYTLPIAIRTGFTVEKRVGNQGSFPYPKEDFLATVAVIKDINTLENARVSEREEIINLRKKPVQTRFEKGPKGNSEILFDLRLKNYETLQQ